MNVESFSKAEVRILLVCMGLLLLAAGWLVSTRPVHRIEGDFLAREERRDAQDPWLLEQLNAQQAHTRARACLALGRIGDPRSLPHLIDGLKDHGPTVRAAAAYALGLHQDRQALDERGLDAEPSAAVALLKGLGDEERFVVANAVESLGRMEWKSAWEALTECPAPVPTTIVALARINAPESIPWIVGRLKSDDPEIRLTAALALNELKAPLDENLESEYVRLAKDRNNWVRLEAAAGLGRARPGPEAAERLIKLVAASDAKERITALLSLGKLRIPDTLPYVVTALGDPIVNVRVAALRAMADYGDPGVVSLLQDLRGRASPVSYEAERTLARLATRDNQFLSGLDSAAYQTVAGVQAVAEALSQHKLPGAALELEKLWRRDDEAAQAARPKILEAIARRLGPEPASLYIGESLTAEDPAVRKSALNLWPQPAINGAQAAFQKSQAQSDTAGQRAALDAAARAEPIAGQKNLFLSALEDPSRHVRLRAARYLRRIYQEDHQEAVGTTGALLTREEFQRVARTQGSRIHMETTIGQFDLVLDYYEAPRTAENFLRLAKQGFYDGQRFIVWDANRFVQAGDPAGNGAGGPGYTIPSEINGQPFLRGSLGMAVDERDTGGSQFFICLTPQPLLNGRHTNFGRLVSGDNLLDQVNEETRILKVTVP